ncbi:MAG TPA: MFS transporter [Stellaceae bacterium]|jgi:putative MFS transporter
MAAPTSHDLLAVFDRGPLNARYWTSFGLLAGVYILDFFDFFLIAFILAVIGPSWHLTYGQAALILYGSGVGAIVGALVWGSLSDVFGRKLQTVTGTLICGVAGGLIGFLPTGAFVPLAILRFFVGFGLAAAITPALTIIVELTPTRWRSGLTSLFVAAASLGPLSASLASHALLRALGWRGIAMFGLLPVLIGLRCGFSCRNRRVGWRPRGGRPRPARRSRSISAWRRAACRCRRDDRRSSRAPTSPSSTPIHGCSGRRS